MILSVRVNNSYVFRSEVELSMEADMRIKKFGFNVHNIENYNILKTVGIYGSNNVGKTCLLKCIRSIKDALLNKNMDVSSNLFTNSSIAELGITFLHEGKVYSYDYKFDTLEREFIYEKLSMTSKDDYANEKEVTLLLRDTILKKFEFEDESIQNMMKFASKSNIMIYLVDASESDSFELIKSILVSFANKIDYVDMNNIPLQKTIDLLKNKNDLHKKITNFILNADLDMDSFEYSNDSHFDIKIGGNIREKAEEKVLDLPDSVMDQIKLTSIYNGHAVASILFDSTGTKKIIALSSYIIDALENGRILVVDELDSSIHFKLARAIVSMFNNELNSVAQLIFTVHDINLMDCKKLFRKEQIWFIHKDEDGVYVYSLSDFTSEDGIRSSSDIIEKYKKGELGAIPDPRFINTLIEVNHEK